LKSVRASAALVLATLLLVVAATAGATAQTFKTLHSFNGTDGAYPYAAPVQATNGNLYGTTYSNEYKYSIGGTVFKITPGGTLTTLHSFKGTDGLGPSAGLVQATNANLYGTTQQGGAQFADGMIFKITPNGNLKTLYSFCSQSNCADGTEPYAGLIQATNGNLYGTTEGGNATICFSITGEC
jgi:uncharacterized repeat protein (TIGR03803 family)